LRRRRGGLSFIELATALLIIAVASLGTVKSFYIAHDELSRAKRRFRANQFLKQELEFWVARLHKGNLSPQEYNLPSRERSVVIDYRGPGPRDNIVGHVRMVRITPYDDFDTAEDPDYWIVRVAIRYDEPRYVDGQKEEYQVVYKLDGAIVKAG